MFCMKRSIPKYIHPAGYGKSTLAFLLDTVFTIAMIFILYYAFGRPVLQPAQNYQGTYDEYTSFIKDSGLTTGDQYGTFLSYDYGMTDGKYGYQHYQDAVLHYYTVFIPSNENAEFQEEDGVFAEGDGSSDYQTSLAKFVLKKVYKLNEDGSQIEDGADPYFILNEATADDPYDVTLAPAYQGTLSDLQLTSLNSYFYNASEKSGVYYDAMSHFTAQPYFLKLQNLIGMKKYISFLPSFILSPLIFFFIIPVCVPNGRTLGKLIARTAVLGADGYKAKKLNIILHYAILTVVWEFLLIPSTAIGIMGMALCFLIDYVVLVLSKNHQSAHDKVARTIVVRSKDSIWFADKETEEEYVSAHPDSTVAGFYQEENGCLPGQTPKTDAENARILLEESILDLSTIGKARREAKTITSFDEFENRGNEEAQAPSEKEKKE